MLQSRLTTTTPTTSSQAHEAKRPVSTGQVRLSGVSLVYAARSGPLVALEDVNLEVSEGSFVSILGPSGCGKSTLLRIVGGLLPPSAGQVLVNGEAVHAPVTETGFVFQTDLLLPWRTALDNVMLQAEIRGMDKAAARDWALAFLDRVGLEGFSDRLPSELSGGMRQRVALVRALLHDPPILLMDEPFGALDAITRDEMNLELERIWSGTQKTVLFITHAIEEAIFLGDRVVVMSPRPGKVSCDLKVDLPRPRELSLKDSPEFRRLSAEIRTVLESMGLFGGRG